MLLKNLMLGTTVTLLLALTGCDSNDGPAEKAGAKLDNAVDEAGDKIESAGDTIEKKLDN
jgi:hypothetical protein